MPYNAWTGPFLPMVDDAGVALTNTVTQTAISPGALTNPMYCPGGPGGLKAGAIVELEAWGTVSTSGTTPTLIIGFYYGALALALAATTTGLVLTNQAAVAWPWRMWYKGRVTNTGTSGSINGMGAFENPTSLTAFTPRRIPETTAAEVVTIDTSINKLIVVAATWGAAASTNIITCNGMRGGAWG